MDSASAAPDALSTFLGFPFQKQLEQVAERSVRYLRGIARLYGEQVKRDGHVSMERQVERAMGKRIADAPPDVLAAFLAMPPGDQIACINALAHTDGSMSPELCALNNEYIEWAEENPDCPVKDQLTLRVYGYLLEKADPDNYLDVAQDGQFRGALTDEALIEMRQQSYAEMRPFLLSEPDEQAEFVASLTIAEAQNLLFLLGRQYRETGHRYPEARGLLTAKIAEDKA